MAESYLEQSIGSPPHTQGTPNPLGTQFSSCRITPAYAGNTLENQSLWMRAWDHPRLRGEHFLLKVSHSYLSGSPPLTRGTLSCRVLVVFQFGITPAYAGNTSFAFLKTSSVWDHPRLRGEHLYHEYFYHFHQGSPPLTRGTHIAFLSFLVAFGITPAYAGNTTVHLNQVQPA